VSKPGPTDAAPGQDPFGHKIAATIARKLEARRQPTRIVWFGLGMMGLIGWSVTVPTLLGVALGVWLDKHHPAAHSWTLSLLVVGLALGCWNAWRWVAREERQIEPRGGAGDDSRGGAGDD
jgi:ATP synthase protein I